MSVRLRTWARLTFFDPEPVLRGLRDVEIQLAHTDTPELVRRLRTGRLKCDREARDALLFAQGMARVVGAKVYVAPGETEDCDFVTRATVGDTTYYSCVQLKELVPDDLNPSHSLESLVAEIAHLPPSDTVLAIRLNRRGRIDYATLAGVRVPFAELWYFWAASPESNSWCLFGDAMGQPVLHEFQYPA